MAKPALPEGEEPFLFEEPADRTPPEPPHIVVEPPQPEGSFSMAVPPPEPGLFDWPGPLPQIEEENYFLLTGTETIGPLPVSDIKARLADGSVGWDAYAWNQNLDEWLPLEQLLPRNSNEPLTPITPAVLSASYAGFVVRFAAGFFDLLIIVVSFIVLAIVIPPFRRWIETSHGDPQALFQVNLVLSIVPYVFYLLFLGPPGKGRTPGYRIMRIRLADQATGGVPTALQALLWCVGSVAMPFGWVFYWFDPARRMLHNMLSRTIVVDTAQ
jgi:uncharacterized RDD family membrane protein YckC